MHWVEKVARDTFRELDRIGCRKDVAVTFIGDADYFVLRQRDGDRSAVFCEGKYVMLQTLQRLPTACGPSELWRAVQMGEYALLDEDVPLSDRIFELGAYVSANMPEAAVRVAEVILDRGGWITVGNRVEDLVPRTVEGPGPRPRYLVADLTEIATWRPATEEQPMHDLTAAQGDTRPANAAVAGVLGFVRQHARLPDEEDIDLLGAHVVCHADTYLPMQRAVSFHGSEAGAEWAAQRRNDRDFGGYTVALRADVLRR